jgi:hypothetical protein
VPLPVPAAPSEVSGGLVLATDHLVGRAVGGLAKAGDVAPIEDLAVERGDRLAQPIRPDVIGQLPEIVATMPEGSYTALRDDRGGYAIILDRMVLDHLKPCAPLAKATATSS